MGLFNFKIGGSKKEQDKPIRDKIKNRKYFNELFLCGDVRTNKC